MSREWWDKPYWDWEHLLTFTTKDGRRVHLLYSPGYAGDKSGPAGKVWAYDVEVDPEDPAVEHALRRDHRVAHLGWDHTEVAYIETDEGWQRQGLATEMFRIARVFHPDLRHSSSQRTDDAKAWIAAVDPEESWAEVAAPGSEAPRADSRSWLGRLLAVFSRS